MPPSSGILVGVIMLAALAVAAGYLIMRISRARRQSAGLPRTSSTRLGSEQIHLGERIESWTRQPAVTTPSPKALLDVPLVRLPEVRQAPPVAPPPPFSAPGGLVAPVELWFGSTRVGVVPDSATHRDFERYANALLSELPKR